MWCVKSELWEGCSAGSGLGGLKAVLRRPHIHTLAFAAAAIVKPYLSLTSSTAVGTKTRTSRSNLPATATFHVVTHRCPSLFELDKVVAACPDSIPRVYVFSSSVLFSRNQTRIFCTDVRLASRDFDTDKLSRWTVYSSIFSFKNHFWFFVLLMLPEFVCVDVIRSLTALRSTKLVRIRFGPHRKFATHECRVIHGYAALSWCEHLQNSEISSREHQIEDVSNEFQQALTTVSVDK